MTSVFIDGSAGTTGLRIADRLSARKDLTLIRLSEAERKEKEARREALNAADIAFLCLPDDAAREAVTLADNPRTVIIDTSTAHRVAPGWVYGLPELAGQRERIAEAKRIANPGCHATGFIVLAAPLVQAGLIPADAALSCFSLTGYSGGGKKMIAQYEDAGRDPLLAAPRMYGLSQAHKHLPEMTAMAGLSRSPVFCPVVAPYYAGMEVVLSLNGLGLEREAVEAVYAAYYTTPMIRFRRDADEAGFLSAAAYAGRDDLEITVQGQDGRLTATARFDNLGKGASGAAIQNMNLVLGLPENTGLAVGA